MEDIRNDDYLLTLIANILEIPIGDIYKKKQKYPNRSIMARIFYIHFSRKSRIEIQTKLRLSRATFFRVVGLYYLKMRSSKEFRYYNDKIENILYQRNKRKFTDKYW